MAENTKKTEKATFVDDAIAALVEAGIDVNIPIIADAVNYADKVVAFPKALGQHKSSRPNGEIFNKKTKKTRQVLTPVEAEYLVEAAAYDRATGREALNASIRARRSQ